MPLYKLRRLLKVYHLVTNHQKTPKLVVFENIPNLRRRFSVFSKSRDFLILCMREQTTITSVILQIRDQHERVNIEPNKYDQTTFQHFCGAGRLILWPCVS